MTLRRRIQNGKSISSTQRFEYWGSWAEFIGLVLLLVATMWEAELTNWWDEEIPEWHASIQEGVNLAMLSGLKDVGQIAATQDPEERAKLFESLAKETQAAYFKAIEEREALDSRRN